MNINLVARNHFCTGCGVCSSICPLHCITMSLDEKTGVFQAVVNDNECSNCNKCLKCCPPLSWSNKPKTSLSDNRLGDYLEFHAVYSNNEKVRRDSASGGFISGLLIFLIKERFIDGAIITKRDSENILIGSPFIAKDEKDIFESSASVYGPVKFDNILKDLLLSNDSSKKYAFVGLPCHIEGITRAQELYPILRQSIILKICVLCGQSPSIYAYNYIFKKFKVNKSEIINFKNRGDGWPGFMQIKLRNSREIKYPYKGKYSMGLVLSNPVFTPVACQKCVDGVGYSADITACDAWLPKFIDDKAGRNLVMIKTPLGLDLFKKAVSNKIFSVESITKDDFVKANSTVINKAIKGKIVGKVFGLKKASDIFHKGMIFSDDIRFERKFLLNFYKINVIIINLVGAKTFSVLANDCLLLYFKFVNYLKSKYL